MKSNKNILLKVVFGIGLLCFAILLLLAIRGIISIPNRISIFGLMFNLYGFIIGTSVFTLYSLVEKYFPDKKNQKKLFEALIWTAIPAIIFARILYIFTFWQYFQQNPQDIIKIWQGGISLWGVIVGGILGLVLFAKFRKVSLVYLFESITIFLPLAQAIGRLGNFVNQEIFGNPTNLVWGMYVKEENRPLQHLESKYFHPLFLYEMLANLILFFVLFKLFKKRGITNKFFFTHLYFISYSFIRFMMDFLRQDPVFLLGLKHSQIFAIVFFVINVIFLYASTKQKKN